MVGLGLPSQFTVLMARLHPVVKPVSSSALSCYGKQFLLLKLGDLQQDLRTESGHWWGLKSVVAASNQYGNCSECSEADLHPSVHPGTVVFLVPP